jgi:hypothetical protein
MRAHDPRIDRLQVIVAQAQLLGLVAAHVAEQAIRGRDQLLEHLAALGVLEVERQRLLVAIKGLEELAVVLAEEIRPDPARHVAAACPMLDLDHLGAHVGQMARAVRPGPILLDRKNAQAFERQVHCSSYFRTPCPSIYEMFTQSLGPLQWSLPRVGTERDPGGSRREGREAFDLTSPALR